MKKVKSVAFSPNLKFDVKLMSAISVKIHYKDLIANIYIVSAQAPIN